MQPPAQESPQRGGPALMAGCMMKNIRNNRNNIFEGCGNNLLEVFSEINGPRRKKYHPLTGRVGYLEDDGSVDYDGPGARIFLPQHFRIQQIHDAYPDATWILNWREFDSWVESVMKWEDDLHIQFLNEYYVQGAISDLSWNKNMSYTKSLLKKIYHEHHDMVRDFVETHTSHALIQVNITDDNAGHVLGEAFGLDPRAWLNVNKNEKRSDNSWRNQRVNIAFDFMEETSMWWLLVVGTTAYLGWFLGVEWDL
jgi:hypothetical protein